jgi:hypothetical protein
MALYGLSVFWETPETQRKGRKRYIVVSFLITVLRALSASLDMEHYFQILFMSTSPRHWRDLMVANYSVVKRLVSNTCGIGLVTVIGDALLVRPIPRFFSAVW